MPEPERYDEQRYLSAKRAIDARSRDERVWARFRDELGELARAKPPGEPLRILELGGGLGHLATEVMAQLDVPALDYTVVDLSPANLEGARATVAAWAAERGMTVEHGTAEAHLQSESAAWRVGFAHREALDYLTEFATAAPWDVIIAQAFLDLVHLPAFLNQLQGRLNRDALAYFPINFDGLTAFEPPLDPELDGAIVDAYHASMDARAAPEGPSAGSRSGRELLLALRERAHVLAAGSSDWIVMAGPDGFTDDEAYFLHHILHFVETSVAEFANVSVEALDDWLAVRRRQIDRGELVFLAHQVDAVAKLRANVFQGL